MCVEPITQTHPEQLIILIGKDDESVRIGSGTFRELHPVRFKHVLLLVGDVYAFLIMRDIENALTRGSPSAVSCMRKRWARFLPDLAVS